MYRLVLVGSCRLSIFSLRLISSPLPFWSHLVDDAESLLGRSCGGELRICDARNLMYLLRKIEHKNMYVGTLKPTNL